ncbi:MAG: YicC/YloC family endoribonuclease [Nitrospinota bacterium]|nr:YicC/YloC family endoribonuclease [Nitrospinota bacterium]
MLRSMTGYGRSETRNSKHSCTVEIRSVNNRHMEIKTKLPRYLVQLEVPLKKLVKGRCSRGSLDLSVTLDKNDEASGDLEIKPNLQLATQYFEALNQIKSTLGLNGKIDINSVLSLNNLIKFEPSELDTSQEEIIVNAVKEALEAMIKMREEEGNNLQSDISQGLKDIAYLADSIQTRQPAILKEYKDRLKEKIAIISEGVPLDEARLAQETAIMADRCDVTEELSRIRSHLQQFNDLIQQEGTLGRKLEFIIQEINREANTIASKTIDYHVSQSVIELKSTLEKIREQILNIE